MTKDKNLLNPHQESVNLQCRYFAALAFLPTGWAQDVLISVDQNGWISEVKAGERPENAVLLNGPVLPGMSNVHSHAFQYAMAGLTERATANKDSFWTWRETMYKFLENLTLEDQQAIASQLYVEMLKAGFTSVAEFHYLHHQIDGSPYEDRALASHAIINAASEAGIAITHLPVLYSYSGFGEQEPLASQRRFINSYQEIMQIISALVAQYQHDPQITIGLALHSLRAVAPSSVQQATAALFDFNLTVPIHIHIAEQIKEVNDCLAWCGQRPVSWLLNNVEVGARWCLVHATQMTPAETAAVARAGAVVGLCPTTEANLGDGLFNLPSYLKQQGYFGIGSDSNVSVNMIEELRLLEYGQRLLHHERVVSKSAEHRSTGALLYTKSLAGGARALGRLTGSIEVGRRADFIMLNPDNPTLVGKNSDSIFDALIFASNNNAIRNVIVGGRQVIIDFHHINEEIIFLTYKKKIKRLLDTF